MKGYLKRNRMTQISASQHLPVRSYECKKRLYMHMVKVVNHTVVCVCVCVC